MLIDYRSGKYKSSNNSGTSKVCGYRPCSEVLRELGELRYEMNLAAERLRHMVIEEFLRWDPERVREVFGRYVSVPDLHAYLQRFLARNWLLGRLRVSGTKVCIGRPERGRCLDLKEYFKWLDKYYSAYGEYRRVAKDLEVCKP